jgi:hypothetical protein
VVILSQLVVQLFVAPCDLVTCGADRFTEAKAFHVYSSDSRKLADEEIRPRFDLYSPERAAFDQDR